MSLEIVLHFNQFKDYRVATFKKGRRKTFDLAVLSAVAVLRHDGQQVTDFTALMGGSLDSSGKSMEKLNIPSEFINLVKSNKLPVKWTPEMGKALHLAVEGDYKRIMAEYFFKEFLTFRVPEEGKRISKSPKRSFLSYDADIAQVTYLQLSV